MRKEALFGCLALAVAVGFAGPAAAGPITWSYQAEALGVTYPIPVPIGPPQFGGGGPFVIAGDRAFEPLGYAEFAFDKLDPAVWRSAAGPQTVVTTRLNFSFLAWNPQDGFQFNNSSPGDYTLTLRLRDGASGQTGQLAFRGLFSGYLGPGRNELQNQFIGSTTGTLTLGEHIYTVTVGPVRLPEILFTDDGNGAFKESFYQTTPVQAGEIDAQVEVSNAPEPASLALAGVGLLGAAAARWRRRWAATA
jgi:hypothetical protein